MNLLARLRRRAVARWHARSVLSLVRAACWAALLALGLLCLSIVYPEPLSVIFAMSFAHVIGVFAFLCYLLAIALDSAGRGADPVRPGEGAAEVARPHADP